MSELRIHDAPTLPCDGCGAALPADPTASHAFCPMCHAWRAIPDDVRQRAWQVMQATWRAEAEAASHLQAADAERRRATVRRAQHRLALLFFIPWFAFSALVVVVKAMRSGSETLETYEVEPISAAITGVLGGITALVLLGVAVANGIAFWKLYTRHHRRAARRTDKDWFAGRMAQTPASCGSCGAPIAFRPGERSVTCGHCRASVVSTEAHGHQLIAIAYDAAQLAALERARQVRKGVKQELSQRRRMAAISWLFLFGTCFAVLVPLLLIGYTFRTITRSAEQQVLDLGRDLGGEFGAGMPPLFDWLDTFWIGEAPRYFTHLRQGVAALMDSRWSVAAVFHDRPVLVCAITGATDRFLTPYLLLARPRTRSAQTLARAAESVAAARIRALGCHYTLGYPGVTVDGPAMLPGRFDAATVTELARAAYELAEEP